MERYTKILGAIALCAMACGTRGTGTTVTPDPDSGMALPDVPAMMSDNGTVTDTPMIPPADVASTTDRGVTPTDRPVTTTDRPTGSDAGSGFGTCGSATVGCLCTAGMDAMAQGRCFGANATCAQCLSEAIGSCCPMQVMAFQDCAVARMCMDQACATAMCRTEYAAIDTCFQAAQMTSRTCQSTLSGCFGSYPFMCM